MIRFVLLCALAAGPVQARSLFEAGEVVDPAVAHAGLERVLGTALPEGTEVLLFIEGGFQDVFWQFSLSVPEAALPELLQTFGATEPQTFRGGFEPFEREDWAPSQLERAQYGPLTLGAFPAATGVWGHHPDHPGRVLFLVFANEI